MLQLVLQIIKVGAIAAAAAVLATHFLLTPLPELSKSIVAISVTLVLITEMLGYYWPGRVEKE
jgi:hypothetical protein